MRERHDDPEGRDELAELRALWGALDAPAPDDSDAEVGAGRDARADEAVRRLRAVWVRLEAPRAELPWRLRRRRVAMLVGPLAAAALVLAAVAIALAQRDTRPRDEPVADAGDGPAVAPKSEPQSEPVSVQPSDEPHESPAPPRDVPREPPHGELDARGRLVLRSGSVRLVWIEPAPEPATENTQS